jgi:hypothetical protein
MKNTRIIMSLKNMKFHELAVKRLQQKSAFSYFKLEVNSELCELSLQTLGLE